MKNRVGEKYITNEGYNIEIVDYINCNNCTIEFEDGGRLYNRAFVDIKRGEVKNPNHKVGEKYKTLEGYIVEIIKIDGWGDCTILFDTGLILYNKNYGAVKKGQIKNPLHKSVCGVGYIGNECSNKFSNTYYYKIWKHMIERCYSEKEKLKLPSYKNVIVCDEWHNFQNFARWMENNYNPETMEGWHLDKDILVKGNKIYSPETCCFVPNEVNTLLIPCKSTRGDYPIGVVKQRNLYVSNCNINKKRCRLGSFKTPEEAFQAYKIAKENEIKRVADKWQEKVTEKVYQALYNYQVEITD